MAVRIYLNSVTDYSNFICSKKKYHEETFIKYTPNYIEMKFLINLFIIITEMMLSNNYRD